MWQQWLNFLLGLWIIIVPFLGITNLTTTLVTTGILVMILALWGALYENSNRHIEDIHRREVEHRGV